MSAAGGHDMPIHDWTRVDAGVFHHFHLSWIDEIARYLNRGQLPRGYYALAEQMTGDFGPDVLTLRRPVSGSLSAESEPSGGVAVAEAPPKVRFHAQAEIDIYAAKARSVVIRHRSRHQIIAMVEIVSPGNKNGQTAFAALVHKADQALLAGIHLLIVDLFPPTARDPDGIHREIWAREGDGDFALPADKPLTCVSYVGYPGMQVFLDPVAVGDPLPDMPLFLTRRVYVPVPLEATYLAAWEALPDFLRDILTASPANGRKKPGRGRKKKG
jgi:Protein of unknown function (DUF4058)